jgi:hypothetical protein
MSRPEGSKNKPKEQVMEIPEDENPLDLTEASGLAKGAPDPRAIAAILEANAPQGPEVVDHAPVTSKQDIMAMLSDPDIALAIARTVASTPEGKKILGIPLGKGAAQGLWKRDYDNEKALKVHGGVEVRHPPGFRPLPPDYINMYVAEGGGETNYIVSPVMEVKTEDGKTKQVYKYRPAKKTPDGSPVFTQSYLRWLDLRQAGGRIGSDVRTDEAIAARVAVGEASYAHDEVGVTV